MKKNILKITDLKKEEILEIINLAFKFKDDRSFSNKTTHLLGGQAIALIFEKPSLRTKVAFELAVSSLGGVPIFLSSGQILASGNKEQGRESIPDIAKNLERFCAGIFARVYEHQNLEIIAQSTAKPVLNLLCDHHHPTQALADLMTIIWHKGNYQNLKVTFVGDGNNVATSLMQICCLIGIEFGITSPPGYQIPENLKLAGVQFFTDPVKAVSAADIVYTDTFVSMGQEEEKFKRLKDFEGYQVDSQLLAHAKSDAIFMHCLPAHRGEEVTDEVMDSPQSVVFDQAECRLHIAKALIYFLFH